MRKTFVVVASLGIVLGMTAVPSSAAPLATRVFTQTDCGSTITTNIVLRSNVDCRANTTGIFVGANRLTVNLNGYELIAGSNEGIKINNWAGTTVTGGRITLIDGGVGISAVGVGSLTVSKVVFQSDNDQGVGLKAEDTPGLNVSNSTFDDFFFGIGGYNSNLNVSGSTFIDNEIGILTRGSTQDQISNSIFFHNARGYQQENGMNSTVSSSRFEDNGYGMVIYGNYSGTVNISSNTVLRSTQDGIYLEAGLINQGAQSYFTNNNVSNNGNDGISVFEPGKVTFKGNVTNDNYRYGIKVLGAFGPNGPAEASRNTSNNNGNYGLFAGYPVTGSGNKATGNSAGDSQYQCYNFVCLIPNK